MDELIYARLQMAISLGFHIIFAAIGMVMPFFMAMAHAKWLRTGDPAYERLTRAWMRGVAIFFATGAVSGTALSFELGLLWPEFMRHAGPVIGMPFSWEGAAFFVEAIALGLFLYGWKRLPPWSHWRFGLIVGISGVASGMFVICANAWMNAPPLLDGKSGLASLNPDPWAAMFNARSLDMGVHMVIAAFVATGFAVAGLHAGRLLRRPKDVVHQKALRIALVFAGVGALLQPLSGDITAKITAKLQPVKLAAAEAHFETTTRAPMILGGWPVADTGTVHFGVKVPGLLSFLAFGDFDAEVKGLNDFPRDTWPPVATTHLAYQVMIGLGTLLAGLGSLLLIAVAADARIGPLKRWPWSARVAALLDDRRILRALWLLTPAGFIALEAGWTVTEVGRQPWIIYGVQRTSEALTPMPGLAWSLAAYVTIYGFLAVMVAWLMYRQIAALERTTDAAGEL